jgi:Arc/MetJ-type ribon-helix-helix transcriptional regulator
VPQAKFTLPEAQIAFVNQYETWGFPDKSSLIRKALREFEERLKTKRLIESAELYAQIYGDDAELQTLTDQALEGWPE